LTGLSPRFVVIGANHRSASLSLRDSLFVDDAAAPDFLARLGAGGLSPALVLSTCDRVEVWAIADDGDAATRLVAAVFADHTGLTAGALTSSFYALTGPEAVRHAFMVTAALDSLVVGEPYVPGQVKAALRLARAAGASGSDLETVLQAALAAAKRVRAETSIGAGPVSIAAATVQLARDLHGDLAGRRGLLVGGGDMGELVAESLLAAGLTGLTVTAPRQGRAEALAQSLNGHVVPFEQMREALVGADIVLSNVGGRHMVVTSETMTQVLRQRRRRPMFLVDMGIPGDIEPAVNRLEGAFLYDLADLERVALQGLATREQAASAARTIIDEEVAAFLKGRAARAAVPAIVALRHRFEAMRDAVLAETGGDAAEATRLLVNRLLHAPSETMRAAAAGGEEWEAMEKVLRALFRLDEETSPMDGDG
jgi:glutamyl-tRNA reductase